MTIRTTLTPKWTRDTFAIAGILVLLYRDRMVTTVETESGIYQLRVTLIDTILCFSGADKTRSAG